MPDANDTPAAATPLTVAALRCYPIKGCRAVEAGEAHVGEFGLHFDREWMVVDAATGVFLSQRQYAVMARVEPRVEGEELVVTAAGMSAPLRVPAGPAREARDGDPAVTVWRATFPALDEGDEAAAWFSDALGLRCRLVRAPADWPRRPNPEYAGPEDRVAFADGYPVLVTSEASLADLNARISSRGGAEEVPMERFRPNVVLAGAPAPWAEDAWKTLTVHGPGGPVVLRAAKPSDRCAVTTIDQRSGEKQGPEPLATLARFRRDGGGKVYFGVNFAPERSAVGAVLRVGDAVTAV